MSGTISEIDDRKTNNAWRIRLLNRNIGNLDKEDGYDCKLCLNRGFLHVLGENGEVFAKDCKCKNVRVTLRRAARSGLGNILQDCTFDKFDTEEDWQKKIKEAAMNFCKDESSNWFFIGGQSGSGKTSICTAISAYYIKSGKDLKYMLWMEEIKRLKALSMDDKEYQKIISAYKDAEVLYIDDFLKVKNGEVPTSADMNIAFEIINHRLLLKNAITVISSEKTLDEIIEYDEAVMSRLYQKTGAYKFNIPKDRSKNYRLKDSIL